MPNVYFHVSPDAASALWAIFYALVTGGIGLAAYRIKTWPLVKAQLTAAKVADDAIEGNHWKRLHEEIARLEARIVTLEGDVAECRRRENAAEERARAAEANVARLEAISFGSGQARQAAAILDSAGRIVSDAKEREPK